MNLRPRNPLPLIVALATMLLAPALASAYSLDGPTAAPGATAPLSENPQRGAPPFAPAPRQADATLSPAPHQGYASAYGAIASESLLAPSSVTRYGPHTTGPLSKDVAATFRGGSYSQVKLGSDTTLYRVYGGSSGKMGPYWTRVKPGGPLQSQLDSALAPQWGNTAQNVVKVQVPKGSVIFEGAAAPQSTGVGQLLGGGNQVYIPKVDPAWIVP